MQEILAAAITGGLALVGVILSNASAFRRTEHSIRTAQAVADTKLEELAREVREHNHFARRMPVVEEQIRVVSYPDLEACHKGKGAVMHGSFDPS